MTIDNRLILTSLLLAGLVGEAAFELYAWLISPLVFGPTLEPAKLVMGLAQKIAGLSLPYAAAFALHFLIGSLGFAVVVLLVKRVSGLSFRMAGALGGLVLWFVAQGILAPLMGRAFMMDFGAYTQSSFVAHVGMAFLIGVILQSRLTPARTTAVSH